MASLYIPKWQSFSNSAGSGPLNGGKLNFYTTTTSTRKDTYPTEADAAAETNANPNPVVLNAAGRPEVEIWISGRYRLVVTDANDVALPADDDPIEDSVPASDFQDSSPTYGGTNTGTANALAFAFTPTLTALANGATYRGKTGAAANTSTVTVNQDGLGAKSLVWPNADELDAGELPANATISWIYNSAQDRCELQTVTRPPLVQGTHTIPILASSMLSRTTNGAASSLAELATNDVMKSSKDFDQTTSEGVQFYVPMPKSWNEGTVTAQFGWTAASGAGTVTWSISGAAFGDDDAMDAAFGSAQAVTDTLITANDMHITSATSAITIAGTPAESDFVIFQITRDIADTLNADAQLIWCKVFITYTAGNDA